MVKHQLEAPFIVKRAQWIDPLVFLPGIWAKIVIEMGLNSCNICVTGWFFIKIDEKKWKDKPSIHGKLLFWIYFVKFAQKNFLLNSNASSQSSEVGVSKWKKNRQFLRRFAMFNVTVVCGHSSSKNDYKNDSHSLTIFNCIIKKKPDVISIILNKKIMTLSGAVILAFSSFR